jgi:hypothetical protein
MPFVFMYSTKTWNVFAACELLFSSATCAGVASMSTSWRL